MPSTRRIAAAITFAGHAVNHAIRCWWTITNRLNKIRTIPMPTFSKKSFSNLSTCHPDLQALFFEVVRTFDCTVLEGARSEIDQNMAFRRGATKLKWPDSKHNARPSLAADVAPYPIDWANTNRMYWFAGYVMGIAARLKDEGKITHAIRYGGDWDSDKDINDQKFNDLCHFEIVD